MPLHESLLRPILAAFVVVGWWLVAAVCPAIGGGGPENVLLIVNDLSEDSKTIANYYTRWRKLPDANVLHLSWRRSRRDTTVELFREELLKPVIQAIDERGLGTQIDYLVYSAGFPWRINLKPDHPGHEFPAPFRPVASLTGATYLWQYALQKSPAIITPEVNWYVPATAQQNHVRCADVRDSESRAFRFRYLWSKQGRRVTDKAVGQRYLLSTVLGVTEGRGNTVDEVLAYLRRSVAADRTNPTGTFYFAQNTNPRSKARHNCYQGVAAALRAVGASARIVDGTAPRGAKDVMGFTVGAEYADLAAAQSRVLPGAICEHLTSFGGDLRKKAGQMPLTDFLRLGAAGASGTITEPRAIQAKFPLPSVHLHYRRGCSLAEAFYQSVSGPYQLLIVGDPLCQPWANPPGLAVEGVEPGQTVSGTVEITPVVNPVTLAPSRPCELFVDGRLRGRVASGKTVKLDSTKLSEGRHELRIVAFSNDAIEAQSRAIIPMTVDNDAEESLMLSVAPWPTASPEDSVTLTAAATKAQGEVVFEHNLMEVGRAEFSGDGTVEASVRVPAKMFGRGPVRLRARAVDSGARTRPKWLVIE